MQPVAFPSEGMNEVGSVDLVFSFLTVDGADPAASSYRGGWISSITRSAEGVWLIALNCRDVLRKVLWADATITDTYATPDTNPRTATVTYDEDATGGVLFKVATRNNGTKDDCEGRRVHVKLTCKWRNVDYNYA